MSKKKICLDSVRLITEIPALVPASNIVSVWNNFKFHIAKIPVFAVH